MEDALTVAVVVLFLAAQIFTVGVVVYALYQGMPSIRRELQRQEDVRVREIAELPQLPPLLQSSPSRIGMLAIGSLGGWPFMLIAWSVAGWFGLVVVAIVAVLIAIAMNHELVSLRQKVLRVRSGLTDKPQDKAENVS